MPRFDAGLARSRRYGEDSWHDIPAVLFEPRQDVGIKMEGVRCALRILGTKRRLAEFDAGEAEDVPENILPLASGARISLPLTDRLPPGLAWTIGLTVLRSSTSTNTRVRLSSIGPMTFSSSMFPSN